MVYFSRKHEKIFYPATSSIILTRELHLVQAVQGGLYHMQKRSFEITEQKKPGGSQGNSTFDVLQEASRTRQQRDAGKSKKELYQEILGGDGLAHPRKQERLKEIESRFEPARDYVDACLHRFTDITSGARGWQELRALVAQAETGRRGAWKSDTKSQKYEAERDYRDATRELEAWAKTLKERIEGQPSAEVRALLEKVKPLSLEERKEIERRFHERYENHQGEPYNSFVEIDTYVRGSKVPHYKNEIDPTNAIIMNFDNKRKEDQKIIRPNQEPLHLSDIMWMQARKVGGDSFKPQKIHETVIIHNDIIKQLQPYINIGENKTFFRGDEGYSKALLTVPGKNKIYFLGQYFPDLEISHIDVSRGNSAHSIESITYHIRVKGEDIVSSSGKKKGKGKTIASLPARPRFEID
jgi:hypothetical protein